MHVVEFPAIPTFSIVPMLYVWHIAKLRGVSYIILLLELNIQTALYLYSRKEVPSLTLYCKQLGKALTLWISRE